MPSERPARSATTLASALRAAIRRLESARVSYGHGTINARDEAAWLVLSALGLPLDSLEPHLERGLTPQEVQRVRARIDERIRTRKPTAYLTREAWLGDYRFYVDERAIVPRSFIAELMRDRLAPWLPDAATVGRALDLCTGSGCLAILMADTFPHAVIDAADVSGDALDVARINVAAYGLGQRITLVRSDLFGAFKGRRYDLIVSNPPYVRAAAMRRLPAEYRREPALALAGGEDGLDLVRRIVARAPAHLAPGGLLVVEVGHARRHVEKAFPRLPLVWPETSGGDDCVFVITREALLDAPAARPQATRAAASLPARASRRAGRASGAAAVRRSRSARGSGGSR